MPHSLGFLSGQGKYKSVITERFVPIWLRSLSLANDTDDKSLLVIHLVEWKAIQASKVTGRLCDRRLVWESRPCVNPFGKSVCCGTAPCLIYSFTINATLQFFLLASLVATLAADPCEKEIAYDWLAPAPARTICPACTNKFALWFANPFSNCRAHQYDEASNSEGHSRCRLGQLDIFNWFYSIFSSRIVSPTVLLTTVPIANGPRVHVLSSRYRMMLPAECLIGSSTRPLKCDHLCWPIHSCTFDGD